jgi:hypothetical protein
MLNLQPWGRICLRCLQFIPVALYAAIFAAVNQYSKVRTVAAVHTTDTPANQGLAVETWLADVLCKPKAGACSEAWFAAGHSEAEESEVAAAVGGVYDTKSTDVGSEFAAAYAENVASKLYMGGYPSSPFETPGHLFKL